MQQSRMTTRFDVTDKWNRGQLSLRVNDVDLESLSCASAAGRASATD